jgi:hypothetical protein
MSDAVNFAQIDGQHLVELLPARAVMSIYACSIIGDHGSGANGNGGGGGSANSDVGDSTFIAFLTRFRE